MTKSARDYPVNNPYNPPIHNGKDRPTPLGTEVFEGETRILTGNTGLSTGPHLHTQAGTDEWCQNIIDPTPYEFKKGTVVHRGTATEWGKYVILKVGTKYICYAHLSKNSVETGQIIEEKDMTLYKSQTEVANDYKAIRGSVPPTSTLKYHVGRSREAVLLSLGKEVAGQRNKLSDALTKVRTEVEDLRNRPPEVVIKEVEKIVEKEVIKEVPVESEVEGLLERLIAWFKSKWNKE